MNEYELGLTQSAAENEQETFETLMTAAREIAQSQEQDFQALKDRPWYKSLLKTLTFSNSSEQKKLLAKDISSLSKLNEITWRALYLLSKSSANMAAQIEQNAANIEQLLRQQGVLFDSVKRIVEQVINAQSRSRRKSSLQSLTEQNRNLFAGTLYTLSKQMPEQPEVARQYLSRLLPVLNIHAPEDDIAPEELETLSREDAELLYQLLAEYQLLTGGVPVDELDMAETLPVSPRRRKEIWKKAQELAGEFGPDFFIAYFQPDVPADQIGADEIELTADEAAQTQADTEQPEEAEAAEEPEKTEEPVEPAELEPVTLPDTWIVGEGESVRFQNKIIHLSSPIVRCEGSLEFVNCVIHYGETADADGINLNAAATLRMRQCTVICHGEQKKTLFNMGNKPKTTSLFRDCKFIRCKKFLIGAGNFRGCKFESCAEFFSTSWIGKSLFEACVFDDPGEDFIHTGYYDDVTVTFRACRFKLPQAQDKMQGNPSILSAGKSPLVRMERCIVRGPLAFSTGEEAGQQDTLRFPTFINACTQIENCVFHGVPKVLARGKHVVRRFVFANCIDVINDESRSTSESMIEDCRFDSCMEAICLSGGRSAVRNCQFNTCYRSLIRLSNGAEVDLCEFNDCENDGEPVIGGMSLADNIIFNRPIISLSLSDRSKNDSGKISDCTFNGVRTKAYRIIGVTFITGKKCEYAYRVEGCYFVNCTTGRKDKQLIGTTGTYLGAFKKEKTVTVISLSDCKGLDAAAQLNEADLACSKPKPYGRMIKTREGGERIGCREEDLPAINPGALRIEPQM